MVDYIIPNINAKKNKFTVCHVCAKFEVKNKQRKITGCVKKLYKDQFGIEMTNLGTSFVPNIVCTSCYASLRSKRSTFASPAQWREPLFDSDCYFCANDFKTVNTRRKANFVYKDVPSLTKPVLKGHSSNLGTSREVDDELPDVSNTANSHESANASVLDTADSESSESKETESLDGSQKASQAELNDLVRDLGLPKDGLEYLASWQ